MDSWERAFHAYGPARGGDELLDVLRRGEEEQYASDHPDAPWLPYSFLWTALYCGGRITPATVLGLRHLSSAVAADDFGGHDPTLREAAVWWIREVARTVLMDVDLEHPRPAAARRDDPAVHSWLDEYLRQQRTVQDWDEQDDPGRILRASAEVDCFDALPEAFRTVASLLAPHQEDRHRNVAASAAAMLVRHPELTKHRAEITAHHLAEAAHATPLYRASLLLGLGELGDSTEPWLDDPHLGVRVCAALATALETSQTALDVLRSAAALDPHALDHVFGDRHLPQLPRLRHAIVNALCERVADSDSPRPPASPP